MVVSVEAEAPVAGGEVLQVPLHVRGDVEPAEALEDRDHLGGVEAGGRRVPDRERRDPVGVDVLRRLQELAERRDRVPAGNSRFPSTRLSIVAGVGSRDPHTKRRSFEALAQAYWRPVYKYLRLRWHAWNRSGVRRPCR